jgi:hypothetical protein
MKSVDRYRQTLISLDDWDGYLLSHSGLPGPRANLELLQAVYIEGNETLFHRYLAAYGPEQAPVNSSEQFLHLCGVVGLGKLLPSQAVFQSLRELASDPRWRTREGVCIALQYFGDRDMPALLEEMGGWSRGSYLEQRAAAAALCEPRLLGDESSACQVILLLDEITSSLAQAEDRRREEYKILHRALAYCWSVAVAALPEYGKKYMEKWLKSDDKDVQWVMRENLKKKRLEKMDPHWVSEALVKFAR